jgi:hypothetical protein
MEQETQAVKATVARTPAELLARQVELLAAIQETLENHQRAVMHLAQQQKTQAEQVTDLAADVTYLSEALLPDAEVHPGHQWVKVQDINVPFLSLSMFLVKLSFASIPAALVLWIIGFAVLAFFGLLGLSMFSLF